MKLPINFTYHVQYLPPRMQNPRSMPMTASVEVEIDELDPAETEHVATVVQRKDYIYSDEKFARKKGQPPVRILLANGSFWREDTTLDRLQRMGEGGEIADGYLSHVTRHTTQSTECGDVKDLTNQQRTYKVLSYVPSDRWKDDGGADVARKFRERVRNLAVFDGSVFVRTSVPVISLSRSSYDSGLRISTGPSYGTDEVHYSDWDGASSAFNLDQADQARKFLKLTKESAEKNATSVQIEILRPGIWEAASHRNAVTAVAKEALESMMREPQNNTVELMDKAYDLRDALVEAAGEVTPMLIQVLEDLKAMQPPTEAQKTAWREQAGQYEDRHHSKGRSHHLAEGAVGKVDEIREIAGRALLRWEMRDPNASWEHRSDACPAVWNDQGSVHQILTLSDAQALERLHGIDLSEEIAACVEGRGRLHAAVLGLGGLHLRSQSPHALLSEDEDGAFRLVASSPAADLNKLSDVVAELAGRTFAPSVSAPAPSGGM